MGGGGEASVLGCMGSHKRECLLRPDKPVVVIVKVELGVGFGRLPAGLSLQRQLV